MLLRLSAFVYFPIASASGFPNAAKDGLVAKLSAETRDPPPRSVPHIQVHAENVATVIVMVGVPGGNIGCAFANKLKNIEMTIPINLRDKFQFPESFTFGGDKNGFRIVVLIGIGSGVKGVSAVVFVIIPGCEIDIRFFNIKAALP